MTSSIKSQESVSSSKSDPRLLKYLWVKKFLGIDTKEPTNHYCWNLWGDGFGRWSKRWLYGRANCRGWRYQGAFKLTPGNMHFLATWEADALVSYYTIEKWREGRSWPQKTTTAGTKWTFATSLCTAHSFKLVATLADWSTVKTLLLGPFKPTNYD